MTLAISVRAVRCPACTDVDDKVVDSRMAEDGTSIRRRRECLSCGRRFTTFERLEEAPIMVVKRSGDRLPFDSAKIVGGLRAAAKNRPVADEQLLELAGAIEERLRVEARDVVSTESIGLQVLERLRDLDQVAYLRFASVYKVFEEPADFARELRLLTKGTAPKRH
ncbi:MAG: transcriptional regulator NrdR [Acidimicrobiales bacterium]